MSYHESNYARVKEAFRQKQARAKEEAARHLEELHRALPAVREVDAMLGQTAGRVMEAILSRTDVDAKVAQIKAENQELQHARKELLVLNGYPADYTDVHYECPLCQDTGAQGNKLCTCMRKALILSTYESSGLGQLLQEQTFERFSLHYYQEEKAQKAAQHALESARRFATSFSSATRDNLLFLGKTGLGKTHLCTAIAKTVIDRGYDVVYRTAQEIFSEMQHAQFHNSAEAAKESSHYLDCDLLIIDDLGTELTNQFTVSCLYNIINTRLNRAKPMIINTNLTKDELDARYSDRITSRLLGSFLPCLFLGQDIRAQKLRHGQP